MIVGVAFAEIEQLWMWMTSTKLESSVDLQYKIDIKSIVRSFSFRRSTEGDKHEYT